jgi:hypothetical protein
VVREYGYFVLDVLERVWVVDTVSDQDNVRLGIGKRS